MDNARKIKLSQLHPNKGQLEDLGLPKNPRFIKDEKFTLLCESLQKHPQFLEDRPIIAYDNGGELVVLCGNMRLRAAKELKWKDIPCIVKPQNSDIEELKALSAIDNSNFGDWDMDLLANEWDADELAEWGIDLPAWNIDEEPPIELDEEKQRKDFVVKITFEREEDLNKFQMQYKSLIEDEYKCIISFSGGML